MNLYPIEECVQRANEVIAAGGLAFQTFICSGCGIKQTMETPNAFYTEGECEECKHVTNIRKDGCNWTALIAVGDEE